MARVTRRHQLSSRANRHAKKVIQTKDLREPPPARSDTARQAARRYRNPARMGTHAAPIKAVDNATVSGMVPPAAANAAPQAPRRGSRA